MLVVRLGDETNRDHVRSFTSVFRAIEVIS